VQKGKFITVEGVEGGGKSTNIAFISDYLKQCSIPHIVTREPGGTDVAEAIREVLLDTELPSMHEDTELLLMFAARAEHIRKKILPALEQGTWVISDRFTDATYAYQGGGRGIDIERIAVLESWVQGTLRPDLTLLFDLDAETGLARTRKRGEADRFEKEAISFFNRIRAQYQTMAAQYAGRYRIVDAAQPLSGVQSQLTHIFDEIVSVS
jgi:dTMP kinase